MDNVINIRKTCGACPSQWEGKLEDGRMFYSRYRWGYLSLRISENITDNIMDAVEGEEIFGDQCGDEYDGCMSTEEMKEKTKMVIHYKQQL